MTRNVADADAWFPYDRCVRHDRKKRVIAAIAAKKAVKPGVNSNCSLYIASHIMPKRLDTNCTNSKQGHLKKLVFKSFKIFGTLRWPPLIK